MYNSQTQSHSSRLTSPQNVHHEGSAGEESKNKGDDRAQRSLQAGQVRQQAHRVRGEGEEQAVQHNGVREGHRAADQEPDLEEAQGEHGEEFC